MKFKVGDFVYWEHGSQPRVAEVKEVLKDEVVLQGMSSKYTMKKSQLQKKIEQTVNKSKK